MDILRNGSERRIKRKERKAKRAEEKYKAAETAFFKCENCGCRFSADRGEYFITGARLQQGLERVSVVVLDCPYCNTKCHAVLSVYLRNITRDELIKGSRYAGMFVKVDVDTEDKNGG